MQSIKNSGKKNKNDLAAALRANLLRRKGAPVVAGEQHKDDKNNKNKPKSQ